MLNMFKNLLAELNKKNCNYCIYKGLSHIEEDLNEGRGDLDILVEKEAVNKFEEIIKSVGFYRAFNFVGEPGYYFGHDLITEQALMLDVVSSISLGKKPVKKIKFTPNLSRMKFSENKGFKVMTAENYLPLILLIRMTSRNPKLAELDEIINLVKLKRDNESKNSYFEHILTESSQSTVKEVYSFVGSANQWSEIQTKYSNIGSYFQGRGIAKALKISKIKFSYLIRRFRYLSGRVLGEPQCRIRKKGFLVAFIGVDGAGKSTLVSKLMANEFYKKTGIKRIYFGGGEYWMPGAIYLNKMLCSVPVLNYIPKILLNLDRKLRLVSALYYKNRGYTVVCDRYYYDDEISREFEIKKHSKVGGFKFLFLKMQLLMKPRVKVIPDVTFFLNVSPEVAHGRKQDFSFEKMLDVNLRYKTYMQKQKKVKFIDADKSEEQVYASVLSLLDDLERNSDD